MFTLLVLNQQRKANEEEVSVAEAEVEKSLDKAPRLSIRIVIWILPSDTLFGDDLYSICFDHPNRETAMLCTVDM